ncbi:nitric oxide synthase oxygenase [Sorangium sp. So ce1151]|uniref:nitric oxide synthase oxygenase n=1 Tax=Sorangium sp. So ce1151 TaxID=3133332 RepID=UPI003F639FFC
MDSLALHVVQAFDAMMQGIGEVGEYDGPLRNLLEHLGEMHRRLMIPTWAYALIGVEFIRVAQFPTAEQERLFAALYRHVATIMMEPIAREERLIASAEEWLRQMADELQWSPAKLAQRLLEVKLEVIASGTYTHTTEELTHGARVAWRNSAKCIGRISWSTLEVRDRRHVTDPQAMFAECLEHLKLATGGTNLLSVMTVFRPKRPEEPWGPRFWTSQFVRYAGYHMPGGKVLGDPANAEFTAFLIREGLWQPPAERSQFDVLPLVLRLPEHPRPFVFELPREYVYQCRITHPRYDKVTDVGLRWCTVPVITGFDLVLGGIHYVCCPFNGWFMDLEVVRNLMERYNVAEPFAAACGIDTSERLWRNRAFHELTIAVLHSFEQARMTMVDQATASESFLTHCQREREVGRECPAQWSWIGGLVGPNNSVWRHEMRDFLLEPQYHYCAEQWLTLEHAADARLPAEAVHAPDASQTDHPSVEPKPTVKPPRVLILFGSETGTAESAARRCASALRLLRPTLASLNDHATDAARKSLSQRFTHVLVVTSTFGKGQPPSNADRFLQSPLPALDGLAYAVLGLGSSIYPDFCRFAVKADEALAAAGARPFLTLTKADEAKGSAAAIADWIGMVGRMLLPPSLEQALLAERMERLGRPAEPPVVSVRWLEPPAATGAEPDAAALDDVLPAPEGSAVFAECTLNEELLAGGDVATRSTRHLAFALPAGATYQTGDHVAVYPLNAAATVLRLTRRLGCSEQLRFPFEVFVSDNGDTFPATLTFPTPATLAEVLRARVDLKLQAATLVDVLRLIVKGLAPATEAPDAQGDGSKTGDRARVTEWLGKLESPLESAEAREVLSNSIMDQHPTIVDLLEAFPEARVQLGDLLVLLPRLAPRYYSIASSATEHPRHVHLMVGVVHVRTNAGAMIHGVCSNYLANLRVGDRVRLAVRSSSFRAPAAHDAPVVLIGPGTGLAPIMAFLQDRQLAARGGRALGDCHVFFGCRNPEDRVYAAELDGWAGDGTGVITHLHLAYSRADGQPRTYVQDRMREMGAQLAELLRNPATHVYICGDARMADGCFEAAVHALSKHAGISRVAAVRELHVMRMQNRWQLDVWGIISHFAESRDDIRHRKQQAAKLWLQQFA